MTKSFPCSSHFFLDRPLYAPPSPELTGGRGELIIIPDTKNRPRRGARGLLTWKGGLFVDVRVGDTLELKKEHPCGSRRWQVLRVGMDFRLRCEG